MIPHADSLVANAKLSVMGGISVTSATSSFVPVVTGSAGVGTGDHQDLLYRPFGVACTMGFESRADHPPPPSNF